MALRILDEQRAERVGAACEAIAVSCGRWLHVNADVQPAQADGPTDDNT